MIFGSWPQCGTVPLHRYDLLICALALISCQSAYPTQVLLYSSLRCHLKRKLNYVDQRPLSRFSSGSPHGVYLLMEVVSQTTHEVLKASEKAATWTLSQDYFVGYELSYS